MFKTIVLALDGSKGSRQAIPLAAELARHDGAGIVIAHVQQDMVGKGGTCSLEARRSGCSTSRAAPYSLLRRRIDPDPKPRERSGLDAPVT